MENKILKKLLYNNSGMSEQEEAVFEQGAKASYAIYKTYINAGFEKEQAFELLKLILISSKKKGSDANG